MYNSTLNQKKIPTPLALLALLMVIVVVPLALRKSPNTTNTKAEKISYDRMEVSNITQQSVSISFHTDKEQSLWVVYGTTKDQLNKNAFDDRDIGNKRGSYHNHYISLSNLQPATKYYYKIIGQDSVITASNNESFVFRTTSTINSGINSKPAFGKIITANGSPAAAIVFLEIEGVKTLSSLTKSTTGEFLIPTYSLIKNNYQAFFPADDTIVRLRVVSDDGTSSTIKTIFNKISPIDQTVILGKDYDFLTDQEQVLGESTSMVESFKKIDIIQPLNNASIPGRRPLFKGVGIAGKQILLTLNPGKQNFQTTVAQDGSWKITSTLLDPKEYSLVMKTTDEKGKEVVINRSFSIPKGGEAVLGEATGSATITPQATVTTGPTTAPTETPTLTSTLAPTTGLTITPSPSLPVTGGNFFSVSIFSVALIVLGAGIILIF